VFSDRGVSTGSAGSNGTRQMPGGDTTPAPAPPSSRVANLRNSTAPRESRSSRRFQPARTSHASARSGWVRQYATRSSRISSPANWRLLKTASWSARSVRSSPMMRSKPSSGCAGFESQ
jgi:hypothetical protein